MNVALYFDDLHTKSGDMRHVQLAAENFIHTGLSVGDYIGLFTASSTSSVDFTPDPSQVLNVLSKLTSRARAFDGGACPRITPQDAYLIANHLDPEAYQVALAQAVQCNCADQANTDATCPRAQEQLVMVQAQQAWEPLKELSESTIETIKGVIDYLGKEPGERVLVLASSGFLSGMLEAQVDGVVDDALRAGSLSTSTRLMRRAYTPKTQLTAKCRMNCLVIILAQTSFSCTKTKASLPG